LDAVLVQDWVTLALASSVISSSSPNITQGADRWLKVPTAADAVFFLDVKQPGTSSPTTATVNINYQTAPRREDASFVTMLSIPLLSGTTTVVSSVLAAYAQVPVSKYVRWQLAFSANAYVTFRLWMATYSFG
jgi:hypothetical protein